ncbi:MAG: hypothetical protein AAF598_19975 [Bacteroidota bacterium]
MQLLNVTLDQRSNLQAICADAYSQFFTDHWTANGLELYLEDQFGTERLVRELVDPLINYYLIQVEEQIIGFIKVNHHSGQLH